MPLLVLFVTANERVIDTVVERRTSLVPADMRANAFAKLGGEEVILSVYRVTDRSTTEELIAHVCARDWLTASGVVLLTDDSLPGLVDRFGDVFSVNRFEAPAHGRDPANILTATLAKCLRTFRHYKVRFDDLKYQQVLRLPLRNFEAAEIADIRAICHDMMNRANFSRELDGVLRLFRLRQRPKKASSYRDVYLVDDDEKHFRLGPEVHARADTACPPHNSLCLLGNGFRFGRAFDGTRHFNVSRDAEARMAASYPDCHDIMRSGLNAKHLNMFTNDFF